MRDMRDSVHGLRWTSSATGITIKAQNARVQWKGYDLFLRIDTPGHVDFGYERSAAASQPARAWILVVDASQGIEAQTLANCYQAIEHDLAVRGLP